MTSEKIDSDRFSKGLETKNNEYMWISANSQKIMAQTSCGSDPISALKTMINEHRYYRWVFYIDQRLYVSRVSTLVKGEISHTYLWNIDNNRYYFV